VNKEQQLSNKMRRTRHFRSYGRAVSNYGGV